MWEGNLPSTGKEKNIKYTASQYNAIYHDLHEYTRTLLHSLVENYISGIIQFITYIKKVMVEEAEKKEYRIKDYKVTLKFAFLS